ncbi:MAG: hypothetical protein OIF47_03765 [Marinibacterium sp.]|nr:hypothetical protein [Marinibacterium sp.]
MAQLDTRLRADRVHVVGVCGHAGAGKSTLCRQLVHMFAGRAVHLPCDLFSRHSLADRQARMDSARRSGDDARLRAEENPMNWYDWDGIACCISRLRSQRRSRWDRAWNSQTGALDGRFAAALPSDGPGLVLCDGIYLLHAPVRGWFDLCLTVDADKDVIAARRMRRAATAADADASRCRHVRFELPYFRDHAGCADLRVVLTPDRGQG